MLIQAIAWKNVRMRNQPVAEERSDDHFHLAIHFILPHVSSNMPPTITATTSRHVNRHLVSTGPIVAVANPDMPYLLPDIPAVDYVQAILSQANDHWANERAAMVHGTGGKLLKVTLMPQPIPPLEPLW